MVEYSEFVLKNFKKGIPPQKTFENINNAFISLDLTKDLELFDIKLLKQPYYRLRNGKYIAIFHIDDNENFIIDYINKREEVYKWLNHFD